MLYRGFVTLSLCSLLACLHKSPETATPDTATVKNLNQTATVISLNQMSAEELQALSDRNQEIYCQKFTTFDLCSSETKEILRIPGISVLYLLQSPSVEDLEILNQFSFLVLDIDAISLKQAQVLSQFKGRWLYLDGLRSLDVESAQALSQFKGSELYLNGLTSLDAESAKALSQFQGSLYLNGLTSLDAETAQALSLFQGWDLYLNGLTSLDAETAKALSQFKGGELYLNGLTSLDAETAQALSRFQRMLILDGLTSLDAETAQALSQFKGNELSLPGLRSLDVESAKALSQFQGGKLYLNGLQNLAPEVRFELEKNSNIMLDSNIRMPHPDFSGFDMED